MVNRVEKIIGSAEKNRVGQEPEPCTGIFFTPKIDKCLFQRVTKLGFVAWGVWLFSI